MLQLTNISNYSGENNIFKSDINLLTKFLAEFQLDGLEMVFVEKWDEATFPDNIIFGTHLWFWGDWLDFWHDNTKALKSEYSSVEEFKQHYLTLDKDRWLENFSKNIIQSQTVDNLKYMVFHVSNSRFSEVYDRNHYYSDEKVIDATIDLINNFSKHIKPQTQLLFENLWWPGMTLTNPRVLDKLFTNINHQNCGIMLDTGHLINTNPDLKTQEQAVEYILKIIDNLGMYKNQICGIHLHQSLTGEIIKQNLHTKPTTIKNAFEYINKIDPHKPFTDTCVQKIIQKIEPKYLVHEFLTKGIEELSQKIKTQQQALNFVK